MDHHLIFTSSHIYKIVTRLTVGLAHPITFSPCYFDFGSGPVLLTDIQFFLLYQNDFKSQVLCGLVFCTSDPVYFPSLHGIQYLFLPCVV